MKKASTKKWTMERRKKFLATIESKRKQKNGLLKQEKVSSVKEAIIYLQHAELEKMKELETGKIKKFSKADILMMMALKVLLEYGF